ncbi:hypothetical protein Trco_001431 [Trichoderma cornu-damae]|uniref:Uncharacterized protein n=1 Tax=Trichoderma cornu-damae TaxID=654480 RepID=A0A9P8QSB3_9HYPO|nr:hypothetical protein Trco_001431 [Trichoderma cornu-damae]
MPTPLDNAMKSKGTLHFLTAALESTPRWSIFGGDMFPAQEDPKGDPETWTREEMRRWLAARNLFPHKSDTREQLLARVLANMRHPST